MGFLPLGEVRKLGNRYDAFQCQALACLYQRSLPSPGLPPWPLGCNRRIRHVLVDAGPQ